MLGMTCCMSDFGFVKQSETRLFLLSCTEGQQAKIAVLCGKIYKLVLNCVVLFIY